MSLSCNFSQTGAHDLRPTLSGPSVAFHDHFNKFKRTDSESSGGSLASMGLSILSRGGSRKAGRNVSFQKRSQKILRTESFCRTKPGRFGLAMDLICSASGWRVGRTSESSDGARRVRFKLCLLSRQVVPDPEIVWDSCQQPPLFAKI